MCRVRLNPVYPGLKVLRFMIKQHYYNFEKSSTVKSTYTSIAVTRQPFPQLTAFHS